MGEFRQGIAVLSLLCATAAPAGQLVVEEYGLKDVAARAAFGDVVFVGTVVAVTPEGRSSALELTVEQVFPKAAARPRPGERVRRTRYPGVAWTDPHKSPIDHRLRGAKPDAITPGMKLVVVPGRRGGVEVLTVDDAMLRRLAFLFEPEARARYAKEPEAKLIEDLGDPELADAAQAELARRGALSAAALLAGDERALARHYRSLPSAAARVKLATEAMAAVDQRPELGERLAALLFDQPDPQAVPLMARLAARWDFGKEDERRLLGELRGAVETLIDDARERRTRLDLSPLAEFFVAFEARRPDHQGGDDLWGEIARRLDRRAKARVAVGFLGAIYTSTHASPYQDEFLLEEATRLAEQAPTTDLLEPLAKMTPFKPKPTPSQEETMGAMLRIATAVARAAPRAKPRVRAIIEPWLMKPAPTPPGPFKAYRAVVGR